MRELQRQSIKVNIVLTLNFYKAAEPDVETVPAIFFRSKPMSLFQLTTVEELQIELRRSILNFDTKIESFQMRGSGKWMGHKNMDKFELADYLKST